MDYYTNITVHVEGSWQRMNKIFNFFLFCT